MASPLASSGILTASDEMLSSENGGSGGGGALADRVDDLERRIQSQEDELMCLRSSTAEALRRLNGLEQSLFSGNSGSSNKTTTAIATSSYPSMQAVSAVKPQSSNASDTTNSTSGNRRPQSRLISRSAYNLHTLPPKNRLSNGHSPLEEVENRNTMEADETDRRATPQTYPRPRRYIRRNADKANPQIQGSNSKTMMTATPMRKWMSSADVKCNGRRSSTDHLVSKDSRVGVSTANLSRHKSTGRLGSTSSLNASQRSLTRFGLELREPQFLREKGVLQVFVNGKAVNLPAPTSVTDLDPLRELDAPACKPSLDWVYGYRGKDCRGNLHALPTGEVVYFTGAVVVLHNPSENLQRYYTKHTSDIKCMALHPNKLHVATGQTSRRFREKSGLSIHRSPISSITELNNILETDQYQAHVRIWDSVTLQTLRTIGMGDANANFDRGVQCCAFSHAAGGAILAVVDDSYEHTLSVWEWQQGKKTAEIKSANDQVFACEFHPHSKNTLISYGKGHFNIWKIDGTTLTKKPITFEGRNKPKLVLCSHFTEHGQIITGDSNGTLTLWDTSQVKVIRQAVKVHDGGVWALCLLGGNHFISAGKDRTLLEWETNSLTKMRGPMMFPDEGGGCIRTITPASGSVLLIGTTRNTIWSGTLDTGFHRIQQGHADGVTLISAHPTKPQFLSSCTDNTLRLCDTDTKTMLWSLHLEAGICCIDFHPQGNVFAVGFGNGSWAIYDFTNRTQLYAFSEGVDAITTMRFSTTGNFLAIATKEKKLLIYAISGDFRHYVKAAEITDLNAPISTIDWSTDVSLLRANDDDLQHYVSPLDKVSSRCPRHSGSKTAPLSVKIYKLTKYHRVGKQVTWESSTGRPAGVGEAGDVQWASARCKLSFENACILYTSKGTVAAVDRSPDGQYVAIGLSNGVLRFYQYPTTTIMASYKEAYGYSICTRNVAFVGRVLLTDGANDGTVYQWKL